MKSKVKIIREKFHVSSEKGVVVCVLTCDMQLCKHLLYDDIEKVIVAHPELEIYYDGTFEVKGIARCSEKDTFDLRLGKRIAESKAKLKAFNLASKVYGLTAEHMVNKVEIIASSMEACKFAAITEDIHIKHLISQA